MKELSPMKKFFSLFLFLLFQHLPGLAQIDFKEEVKKIDSYLSDKQYDQADLALIDLREALENTSIIKEDSVQLFFSSTQAFVKYQLGDCKGTIAYSKIDTALRKSIYGEGDPLTLSAMRNLGVYLLNCDSTEQARNVFAETIQLHKQNIGQPDQIYARALDDLSFSEGKLGNIEAAEAGYDELIELIGEYKNDFYYQIIENYSALLISNDKLEKASVFYDDLLGYLQGKSGLTVFLRDYYNVFLNTNDYVRALDATEQLKSVCQEASQNCEVYGIDMNEYFLNAARIAMLLERYEIAKKYYQQAQDYYANEPYTYISILLEKAQMFGYLGEKYQQLSSLTMAVGQHRLNQLTDSATYSKSVLELGKIYTELGRFDQADRLFQDYIDDLNNSSSVDPEAMTLAYQSLGNQRFLQQNFADADTYLFKAKALLEENDLTSSDTYASVLNSLGALYESLANYSQAENSYRTALKVSNSESSTLKIALASNLANILMQTDPESDSILILFNQAIEWQELSGKYHPGYANLLNNRGLHLQSLELYDEAKSDYQKALQIFETTVQEDHPQYLNARTNLALLNQLKGEADSAQEQMLEIKALYEKYYLDTNPGYILVLNNLANLYSEIGSNSDAEILFMKLADIQVRDINESFTYLSESEKKNFVKEKQKLLNNFKTYIVGRSVNNPGSISPSVVEKWYDLELTTKGMLLNSTQKVRQQIFNGNDESLKALFSEWSLARKQLADFQSLKSNQSNSSKDLDSLVQKINGLEKELSRQSTSFQKSFALEVPTFQRLRQALTTDEALIEITRTEIDGEGIYTALIGTQDEPHPALIFIGKGRDFEDKAFKAYKNGIAYQVEESRSFQTFWSPVSNHVKGKSITKIYYAPDGVYHRISLATLFNTETGNYLLDDISINQLTSTKDLLDLKKESNEASIQLETIMLVGRPAYQLDGTATLASAGKTRSSSLVGEVSDLPGTELEVQAIQELISEFQPTLLLGETATEENVKKGLNSQLVHIATHGFFIEDPTGIGSYNDPMLYSGLLFAGVSNDLEGRDDGILTAYEIMNLGLTNTDMVVLSACETGLGEVSSGEGIYGLQRAFFIGGVNTVIMSLWKVDDEATRELMTTFYKQYTKKGNKREAFYEAQKKIKKKYKSPIYWGAFVMLEG